jgi:hypothetical protein
VYLTFVPVIYSEMALGSVIQFTCLRTYLASVKSPLLLSNPPPPNRQGSSSFTITKYRPSHGSRGSYATSFTRPSHICCSCTRPSHICCSCTAFELRVVFSPFIPFAYLQDDSGLAMLTFASLGVMNVTIFNVLILFLNFTSFVISRIKTS